MSDVLEELYKAQVALIIFLILLFMGLHLFNGIIGSSIFPDNPRPALVYSARHYANGTGVFLELCFMLPMDLYLEEVYIPGKSSTNWPMKYVDVLRRFTSGGRLDEPSVPVKKWFPMGRHCVTINITTLVPAGYDYRMYPIMEDGTVDLTSLLWREEAEVNIYSLGEVRSVYYNRTYTIYPVSVRVGSWTGDRITTFYIEPTPYNLTADAILKRLQEMYRANASLEEISRYLWEMANRIANYSYEKAMAYYYNGSRDAKVSITDRSMDAYRLRIYVKEYGVWASVSVSIVEEAVTKEIWIKGERVFVVVNRTEIGISADTRTGNVSVSVSSTEYLKFVPLVPTSPSLFLLVYFKFGSSPKSWGYLDPVFSKVYIPQLES